MSFKEPEGDADLKEIGSWAFDTAADEPLKYAAWLTLNGLLDGVSSLQDRLVPGDRPSDEWACEATKGNVQFTYAAWLVLEAASN
jgi:hypothetical protein